MNLATPASNYQAITGPFPAPSPARRPSPLRWIRQLLSTRFYDKAEDWAHLHHSGLNRQAANAALDLFHQVGLE